MKWHPTSKTACLKAGICEADATEVTTTRPRVVHGRLIRARMIRHWRGDVVEAHWEDQMDLVRP